VPEWRPSTATTPEDWQAAAQERERERMQALVRAETVTRLVWMNHRHALKAWDERRDRPVAPWALGFLFAEPSSVPAGMPQIKVASRLVNDDTDLGSGAHLLLRLRELIQQRYLVPGRPFDPTPVVSYTEQVTVPAPYVGVGLSVLGNPTQPWETLRRGDSNDIPGHCYAVLADGTFMLVDRAPRAELSRVTVHATAPMPYQEGSTFRRWRHYHTVEQIRADNDIWEQLYALHCLVGDPNHPPTLVPAAQP
jgi:hypothetical protein